MSISRREFIKAQAAAATAAAAGISLPELVSAEDKERWDKDVRWDKAPCRF